MTPDVFLAEFGDLAETPGGPQRLRELVLKLAVQGCLTERKDDDGTVESLLHVVAANREALAEKYRSRNGVSAGVEVPPFDAPDSWRWVPLGQLGVFLGGGTPSKKNRSFWAGRIPWVSPKDMKRPYIDDATDKITSEAVANSSAKLIPPRALLMVVRGMILAHSFPVALTTTEVTVNQDMKALLLGVPDLDEYLLRALQGSRDRMLAHVARSTHGTCRLDGQIVASFPVPVPPLAEQKRIVAKVDELLALCDELETRQQKKAQVSAQLSKAALHAVVEAPDHKAVRKSWKRVENNFNLLYDRISNVEELRLAIMELGVKGLLTQRSEAHEPAEAMLEAIQRDANGRCEPVEPIPERPLPINWTWCTLADLALLVGDGPFGSRLKTAHYVAEPGYRVIRLGNIGRNHFKNTDKSYITEQHYSTLAPYHLCEGDLVVASLGNPPGRACQVPASALPAVHKADCFRVQLHPAVDRRYVSLVLNSPFGVNRAVDLHRGDTRGRITTSHLKLAPIPLAPLEEQRRIVAKVQTLMKLCDDLEAKLKQADEDGERLMQAVVESLVA